VVYAIPVAQFGHPLVNIIIIVKIDVPGITLRILHVVKFALTLIPQGIDVGRRQAVVDPFHVVTGSQSRVHHHYTQYIPVAVSWLASDRRLHLAKCAWRQR
jgi:hypothetical protein